MCTVWRTGRPPRRGRLGPLLSFALLAWSVPASAQPVIPARLSLQEAVALALARNPAMAEARAAADGAAADRLTAARRPNPALSLDSEGYPLFDSPRPSYWGNQELTVRLDQELELAGRRRLRVNGAEQSQQAAAQSLRDRARQIELETRRAYLAVILAQADRSVAQTALDAIDRVIGLNRERLAQGEISGAELRRLQVERLRFVEDQFGAELALTNARGALLALLNAPTLDLPIELTDTLTTTPAELSPILALATPGPAVGTAALERALQIRPDLASARAAQTAAETTTRLQRALRTPNLTVGGGYRSSFGSNAIVFGVTLPVPLFNQNQGGIARAEADRRAAEARTQSAEIAVRLDVQRALNALDTNRARVRYIEKEYLTNARESRDIVLESYRLGVADLIDFLDAQRAFRDTQRTYNRALFDERVSLFELAAAVGLTDTPSTGAAR